MKTKQLPRLFLSLLAVVTVGCVSSQVGKITLDQAVREYGQPLKTECVSETTRASWIIKQIDLTSTLVFKNGDMQEQLQFKGGRSWKVLMAATDYSFMPKEKLPYGISSGATRTGRLIFYKVLSFRRDGILIEEAETNRFEFDDWHRK